MSTTSDIEQTKQFMRDLCGSGTFRGHGYRVDVPMPRAGHYPFGTVEERATLAGQDFEAHLRYKALIGDDRMPDLHLWSGTEIFAAAFGSPVHFTGEAMPFARPAVFSAEQADRLSEPDVLTGPLGEMFALGDLLVSRYGDDYPVRICDIQSPLDIAALIWDKGDFYPALLENPQAVHHLVEKVTRTMERFLDEFLRRYRNPCLVHYPDYWMPPEFGICLSEDEIGSISNALFDEFSLPYLQRLSDRYGGISMHCCADAEHQWGHLLALRGWRTLNLARSLPLQIESLAVFSGVAVLIPTNMFPPAGSQLDTIRTLLAHARTDTRFFFCCSAPNVDAARRLSDELRSLLGR